MMELDIGTRVPKLPVLLNIFEGIFSLDYSFTLMESTDPICFFSEKMDILKKKPFPPFLF